MRLLKEIMVNTKKYLNYRSVDTSPSTAFSMSLLTTEQNDEGDRIFPFWADKIREFAPGISMSEPMNPNAFRKIVDAALNTMGERGWYELMSYPWHVNDNDHATMDILASLIPIQGGDRYTALSKLLEDAVTAGLLTKAEVSNLRTRLAQQM